MQQVNTKIGELPALIWGKESDRVMVAVHGSGSHKGDTVIALLAQEAQRAGMQILSFDLPQHGDRQGRGHLGPEACAKELATVLDFAQQRWRHISLFGCSLGAYFGLLACGGRQLERCLFLSPVVDMVALLDRMLLWSGAAVDELRQRGSIPTDLGVTLAWEDYIYAAEHPIKSWVHPTAILCGGADGLCDPAKTEGFAQRFGCQLKVLPGGEHYFHASIQLEAYQNWLKTHMLP